MFETLAADLRQLDGVTAADAIQSATGPRLRVTLPHCDSPTTSEVHDLLTGDNGLRLTEQFSTKKKHVLFYR